MTAALQPSIDVGTAVDYFGSIDEHHGSRFIVTAVDEHDRLTLAEHSLGLLVLRHVRRISVEVVRALAETGGQR